MSIITKVYGILTTIPTKAPPNVVQNSVIESYSNVVKDRCLSQTFPMETYICIEIYTIDRTVLLASQQRIVFRSL